MSSSPHANTELSPSMQEAVRLLQAGSTVAAEEVVLRAAAEARQRSGAGSRLDVLAQGELGSVLLNVGQLDRAIDAFREAVNGPMPSHEASMRDRLTFLMNLGQALQMAKRFAEAAEALHKGLEGRESFYGREHAGYAFGLEPLAEVTFELGQVDVALEMMEETVRNFWRNGHPRVAGAIAIRAAMLKGAKKPAAPFAALEKLPNEIIEEIGKQAVARIAKTEDLKISRAVLGDLVSLLSGRLGETHAQTINALIAVSNIERKLGKEADFAIRKSAIARLIGIFDGQGRARDALRSLLALALAHSDAGDGNSAATVYEQALHRVEALGDTREKSQVLRNYGLLLAELNRDVEAEQRLKEAVAEAEKSGQGEMLGRSLIALGLFLQHGARLNEAGPLLARALPMLDPAHPDALTCRSHLQAIETGGSCGCGDMSGAIADAFREFVMSRAPQGLLKSLDVKFEEGDFSIGVHLNREPTEEEVQHLRRITEHALQEFRRKISVES